MNVQLLAKKSFFLESILHVDKIIKVFLNDDHCPMDSVPDEMK